MKEKELREAATCRNCGKKIGESRVPLFWRVTIERYGVDLDALREQTGLEMVLGNVALAQVMVSDKEMAKRVVGPIMITICEDCCTHPLGVAQLAEIGLDDNPA